MYSDIRQVQTSTVRVDEKTEPGFQDVLADWETQEVTCDRVFGDPVGGRPVLATAPFLRVATSVDRLESNMISTRRQLLFVSTLFLAGASTAAVVPRMSLEKLADESEFIVHGRIVDSWTAWDQSHRYIWTHHKVEIHDAIKTAGAASIVISVPGGILDGIGMQASGTVALARGEEVVLFLYRTPIGYLRATGWGQGKYGVVEDPGSGQKRLRAGLRGMTLVEPNGKSARPSRRETSLGSLEGMALSEFKAMIRDLVRRGPEREGR